MYVRRWIKTLGHFLLSTSKFSDVSTSGRPNPGPTPRTPRWRWFFCFQKPPLCPQPEPFLENPRLNVVSPKVDVKNRVSFCGFPSWDGFKGHQQEGATTLGSPTPMRHAPPKRRMQRWRSAWSTWKNGPSLSLRPVGPVGAGSLTLTRQEAPPHKCHSGNKGRCQLQL